MGRSLSLRRKCYALLLALPLLTANQSAGEDEGVRRIDFSAPAAKPPPPPKVVPYTAGPVQRFDFSAVSPKPPPPPVVEPYIAGPVRRIDFSARRPR